MLVDFFFFNPFPYLLLTPPLNLKALYSANWKSSLFSLPFSYLIYGACGVGEKCPTHWPLPFPFSFPSPYPFSYALKSFTLFYLPISFHSFSGKKEPFPPWPSEHTAQGKLPRPHMSPLLFLLSSLLFCWCSFSWWGVGDRTAMGFWGPLTVFFFFPFIETLNIQFQKTKNCTFPLNTTKGHVFCSILFLFFFLSC